MASAIEWLNGGETWNPIRARNRKTGKIGRFCTKPSPGSAGCYAEMMNKNTYFGNGIRYAVDQQHLVEIFLDETVLLKPLHWRKGRLIFPCSMTDWMADFVLDEWRDKMLAVMALTPQHTYLTLTKRADRQRAYLSNPETFQHRALAENTHISGTSDNFVTAACKRNQSLAQKRTPNILPNLWLGVSAENQEYAEKRIPELLQTPAAVRWVSAEPLLGPIDLGRVPHPTARYGDVLTGIYKADGFNYCSDRLINWIVVGGESGPGARPMHPDWARSIRERCRLANVPFFFKQWGEWAPGEMVPDGRSYPAQQYFDGQWKECSDDWATEKDGGSILYRIGKKAAGRLLDGKEHSEYPKIGAVHA
jgi:protein gp37